MNSFVLPRSIVCHDAGAANHIFSWMSFINSSNKLNLEEFRILLDGPALKLFDKYNLDDLKVCKSIEELLDGASSLLSGTGWESDLEYSAIEYASKKKIKSIAVIDHWTNYRDRFIRNDIEQLPSEIWVTDEYAKGIAKKEFPSIKIHLIPNFYLNKTLELINSFVYDDCIHKILYVLEPIREAWGKKIKEGEFIALDYFAESIKKNCANKNFLIKLRPHPSDDPKKYNLWALKQKNLEINIDNHSSLEELIAWSDTVVGCQSYAMVIALSANKKVYTSIPSWAPSCILPHDGIKKISHLEI